jgi:hypothetical protein
MKTLGIASIGLLIATLFLAAAPQERQKPKGATDVPGLLQQAGKAWEAKQFGVCSKSLRQALELISRERAKAIRAALPNAPEGFEKVAHTEEEAPNAYAAAMAVGMGSMIDQEYRDTKGGSSVNVTIAADSPLMQMMSMWVANPSMLDPNSELVKYGAHNAVLQKDGGRWNLMIVVGQDLITANVEGRSDEFLLKMFDQAAVDKLAAAIAN